jgi:hypothetical protein
VQLSLLEAGHFGLQEAHKALKIELEEAKDDYKNLKKEYDFTVTILKKHGIHLANKNQKLKI